MDLAISSDDKEAALEDVGKKPVICYVHGILRISVAFEIRRSLESSIL